MAQDVSSNATEPMVMPKIPLKPNCLNFSEVLAQAVALISPTMTAALIIPGDVFEHRRLELDVLCLGHRHVAVRGL